MSLAMQYGSAGRVSGGRGIRITPLWENDAPTSNFGAQTVEMNLSGYDAVMVHFRITTSSDGSWLQVGLMSHSGNWGGAFRGQTYTYHREFNLASDGVTFAAGYRDSTSGAGYAIPVAVYGITF